MLVKLTFVDVCLYVYTSKQTVLINKAYIVFDLRTKQKSPER